MIPRRDIYYFQQQKPDDMAMSVAARERIGLPTMPATSSSSSRSHGFDIVEGVQKLKMAADDDLFCDDSVINNDNVLQKPQEIIQRVPEQDVSDGQLFDGSKSCSALDLPSLEDRLRGPDRISTRQRPASYDTKRRRPHRGFMRRDYSSIHSERDRILIERLPPSAAGSARMKKKKDCNQRPPPPHNRPSIMRSNSNTRQPMIQPTSLSIKALPREESMMRDMDEN